MHDNKLLEEIHSLCKRIQELYNLMDELWLYSHIQGKLIDFTDLSKYHPTYLC